MITRNFELTLRIPEQENIPSCFRVVQNDKSVYSLTVHLTDGINEVTLSQIGSATITFSKADGNVVQGNMTVGVSSLTYNMGTNEIAYPGTVWASIQLFGGSGERLTSARFRFEVVADLITPAAVQSTSQFPILQQITNDVSGIIATEASRVTAENTRVTAESARQAEVIAARGGFSTLDARLDNTDSDLTDKTNILNFPVTNNAFNGDFNNGIAGWSANVCTITAASYELVCSYTEPVGFAGVYQFPIVITNHIYYVAADYYPKYSRTFHLYLDGTTSDFVAPAANTWNHASLTVKAVTNGAAACTLYHDVSAQYTVGDTWKYRRAIIIDLTAAFGAGKEPSHTEMDYLMTYYTNNWFGGTVNPFRGLKDIGIKAVATDFPVTNLISNGDFSNGATGWNFAGVSLPTISAEQNKIGTNSAKMVTTGGSSIATQDIVLPVSHKIYVASWFYLSSYTSGLGYALTITDYGTWDNTIIVNLSNNLLNQWQRAATIVTTGTSGGIRVGVGTLGTSTRTLYADGVLAIDLTASFGAGKEPSQIEMDYLMTYYENSWFNSTVNPFRGLKDIGIKALATDFPAKNELINSNFANGINNWPGSGVTLTAANNELATLATAQYGGAIQIMSTTKFNGHKLYVAADVKLSNGDVYLIVNDGISQLMVATTVYNVYKRLSGIWTVASDSSQVFVKLQDNNTSGWVNQYMKNVILIDLTATFGVCNEPSVAEMDRILAQKFTNSWFDGTVNPLLSVHELLAYANKNKANIVQEDWITPTFTNGWTNPADVPVGYFKDNFGIVHLKGQLQNGTLNTGAFILPSGYRPANIHRFVTNANNTLGFGYIYTDGSVYPVSGSNVWFALDGITFKGV